MQICRISLLETARQVCLSKWPWVHQVPHRFAVFAGASHDEKDAQKAIEHHPGAVWGAQVVTVASLALCWSELGASCMAQRELLRQGRVKYYFGHTRPVQLLEASDDGPGALRPEKGSCRISSGSGSRPYRARTDGLRS